MMVRAKFYVSEITRYGSQGKKQENGGTVKLRPVYSDDPKHENKAFWNATPSGEITMGIKSDALKDFELGQEYYVDFTIAPELVKI